MSVTVSVNGSSYSLPQNRETGWGTVTTSWMVAVSSSTLQKVGGSFTLTGEVDFGASFGLKSSYYKSRGTNVSTTGVVRLANLEAVSWRNAANGGNLALAVNASDQLTFNGAVLSTGSALTANQAVITNGSGVLTTEAQLAPSRGGTGQDLSAATGLVKVAAGTVSTATLVNADVNAAAAVDRSKLANGTASHVLINDGSGVMSSEAILAKSRGGTGYNLTTQAVELPEISTPSTPASGFGRVYFKSDGNIYTLNDGGVESALAAATSVTARYYASATSISGTDAVITFTTLDFDSASAYSGGTYTVPTNGKYQVNTGLQINGTFALNQIASISIYKNGSEYSNFTTIAGGANSAQFTSVSDIVNCTAGDLITIRASSTATTPTIATSNTRNFVSIARVGN